MTTISLKLLLILGLVVVSLQFANCDDSDSLKALKIISQIAKCGTEGIEKPKAALNTIIRYLKLFDDQLINCFFDALKTDKNLQGQLEKLHLGFQNFKTISTILWLPSKEFGDVRLVNSIEKLAKLLPGDPNEYLDCTKELDVAQIALEYMNFIHKTRGLEDETLNKSTLCFAPRTTTT